MTSGPLFVCTHTDHALIMHQACWPPSSWPIISPLTHAHSPWSNQSPSYDLWLFWTKPRLTCQTGIHVWMPLSYHKTVWFNQDESNLKLRQWVPVPLITSICAKWLQGWLASSRLQGNYFVSVPWYGGNQVGTV